MNTTALTLLDAPVEAVEASLAKAKEAFWAELVLAQALEPLLPSVAVARVSVSHWLVQQHADAGPAGALMVRRGHQQKVTGL